MAVNFLEMNDAPEKFDYFKRFLDMEKYEELATKHLSGRVKEEQEIGKMQEIQRKLIAVKVERR